MKLRFLNREIQIKFIKLNRLKLSKFTIAKSEFNQLEKKMKKRFTMIMLFLSDLNLLLKNIQQERLLSKP